MYFSFYLFLFLTYCLNENDLRMISASKCDQREQNLNYKEFQFSCSQSNKDNMPCAMILIIC